MDLLSHSELQSSDVPQTRSLFDIVRMVRHLSGRGDPPQLQERHINYCLQAARVLGWVVEERDLTEAGRLVAEMEGADDAPEVLALAAQAIGQSKVFRAWMRWSAVDAPSKLNPADARRFLDECSPLKPSTAKHRAGALRHWLRTAFPAQLALLGLHHRDGPQVEVDPNIAPHNEGKEQVGSIVGPDLRDAKDILVLSGYAGIGRWLQALCELDFDGLRRLRFHVGSEPFRESARYYARSATQLGEEARTYWLRRGISLLNARRWLEGASRLDDPRFEARIGAQDGRMLHGKALLTDGVVVAGSSNFTRGGLERNHELNVRWRDDEGPEPKAVRDLAELLWNQGFDYTDELRRLASDLLRQVSWQEALARACASVLEGAWARTAIPIDDLDELDPALWPHQRDALSRILWLFELAGLVLVADPAGSGKTRLGAWTFRMLIDRITQTRGQVRNPVIICPKAVRPAWRRCLQEAGQSVEVFPDSALSHPQSEDGQVLERALLRTDLVVLDEAHRYLSSTSRRTKRLLAAGPEHVLAFTATPLNRDAKDFWGLMELLGADHFDEDAVSAVEAINRCKPPNFDDVGSEIETVQQAFQGCMVRRTRSDLRRRSSETPDAYRLRSGRIASYPEIDHEWYELPSNPQDEELLREIRELTAQLTGMHRLVDELKLSRRQLALGWSEGRYLRSALASAAALARYSLMTLLRSSRVAACAHIHGRAWAAERFDVEHRGLVRGGNTVAAIQKRAGRIPVWALQQPPSTFDAADAMPRWLTDPDAHRRAAEEETQRYRAIAERITRLSDAREACKADRLIELAEEGRVLAFDHHVFSLLEMRERLRSKGIDAMLATGGSGNERGRVLDEFGLGAKGRGVALLSDALNEGVNLQGASAIVQLDWPTVIRVAEQRVGRIDRMDSEHDRVRVYWPREVGALALDRSERRLYHRNEMLDRILGANLVLPAEHEGELAPATPEAFAESELSTITAEMSEPSPSSLIDAFAPVRDLVGTDGLVSDRLYDQVKKLDVDLTACVSLVPAQHPWAFFSVRSLGAGAPQWILFVDKKSDSIPLVGLRRCAEELRKRLGHDPVHPELDDVAGEWLNHFVKRLDARRIDLLAPRHRQVVLLMRGVLRAYAERARTPSRRQLVRRLERRLATGPESTDLAEAARQLWRTLAPYRERYLQERLHRRKLVRTAALESLLLEEPLGDHELERLLQSWEPAPPPSERVSASIFGVPGATSASAHERG